MGAVERGDCVETTVQLRMELEKDRRKNRVFVKEICHVCSTDSFAFNLSWSFSPLVIL